MLKTGIVIGSVGLVLIAVVLVLQLVWVLPGAARPGSAQEPSGITVMAEGKATGKPDLAMITIGVETRDAEARTAAEQNDAQMAAVMDALLGKGVAEEDIRTIDYSIQAEIDWQDSKQRVIGYVVNNSVVVKLREVDEAGDVLDAVTAAGANNIYGIQFTFDDPSALREEARAEAMGEAQAKAQALAQLAGVGLGKPRQISESFIEPGPLYLERAYAIAPSEGGGVAPVSPGQLEVTVQVQVTFDIG
ncbi:MAG TPA: SIMPL domain-containing protein [Anaerolineae bacterium]|nr:SIMPL domain-containing protein [Anaerolineae bacterium]